MPLATRRLRKPLSTFVTTCDYLSCETSGSETSVRAKRLEAICAVFGAEVVLVSDTRTTSGDGSVSSLTPRSMVSVPRKDFQRSSKWMTSLILGNL